jgi:hypothetical protein
MKVSNEPVYVCLDGCKGSDTGFDYSDGQFLIKKYLTHREKNDVIRLTELLLHNIERNQDAILFYSAIAQLAFHIVEAPEWWGDKGMDLIDREPVWALMERIYNLQNPDKVKKEAEVVADLKNPM